MKSCPHCNIEIRVRELPHQGLFDNFRVCPNCEGLFTVDTDTKRRQAICIVILLVSLLFTVLLYFKGMEWLIPALFSYAVITGVLYWGNKNLFFVPYETSRSAADDS